VLRMPFTLKAPSRGVPLAENEIAIGDLTALVDNSARSA